MYEIHGIVPKGRVSMVVFRICQTLIGEVITVENVKIDSIPQEQRIKDGSCRLGMIQLVSSRGNPDEESNYVV